MFEPPDEFSKQRSPLDSETIIDPKSLSYYLELDFWQGKINWTHDPPVLRFDQSRERHKVSDGAHRIE